MYSRQHAFLQAYTYIMAYIYARAYVIVNSPLGCIGDDKTRMAALRCLRLRYFHYFEILLRGYHQTFIIARYEILG